MPDSAGPWRVLMTQLVPQPPIDLLRRELGPDGTLDINPEPDRIWTKGEVIDRLREGNYDALYAMLTNPVDFSALEQGFVDLGSVPQYLPNWAQNNIGRHPLGTAASRHGAGFPPRPDQGDEVHL